MSRSRKIMRMKGMKMKNYMKTLLMKAMKMKKFMKALPMKVMKMKMKMFRRIVADTRIKKVLVTAL